MATTTVNSLILSGASKGFDEMVIHQCKKYPQHKHMICIPSVDPQSKQIVPLTKMQLDVGLPEVQRASLALGRVVTKHTTWPYLQRNAHMVTHAKQVLAFGRFDLARTHVEGVVGWTVQMAKQQNKLLFVFDMDYDEWWYWDREAKQFLQCEGMSEQWVSMPTLGGITALVGPCDAPPSLLPPLERLFQKPLTPSGTFTFKCI